MKPDILKKLETGAARYIEVSGLLSAGDAAADLEKFKTLGREMSQLDEPHRLLEQFHAAEKELKNCRNNLETETDKEMRLLYGDEITRLEAELERISEAAELFCRPPEKIEKRPIIIEIRSGTGGNEAALFGGDLFRMYNRYAENKGWKTEIISASPSALGGFKEVIFSIKGDAAFNKLQYESGVHRVQRIPVTEAGGRIHTSAATVALLIEPDDVEVNIDPTELKIDTYRAQGAGGQHVNKTDSAIRITHLPSGLVVECQDERSQHQNRLKAMRLLRARLLAKYQEEQQKKIAEDRRSQVGSGDRSERIRTYNFPQNRVTDHRADITLYQLDIIIEGSLDNLLEPLLSKMHDLDSEVA
ncbi:MAG: peptide chain release factor 1 [bacterium]